MWCWGFSFSTIISAIKEKHFAKMKLDDLISSGPVNPSGDRRVFNFHQLKFSLGNKL
jgi:hypothetical protein